MTEKRLYDVIDKAEPRGQSVTYEGIPCTARTCVTRLNRLTEENEQLKARIEHLERKIQREQTSAMKQHEKWENEIQKENEQLKKELHLMHIRTMFSTVQSFKGDVSERYTYSDETDTIYDTANHYGKYNKVLDKKEIVMLLNEYETILKELKE